MNGFKSFLKDAEIILEEAEESLRKEHYHRVVRKSQESAELAVKGFLSYLGIEYPRVHILGAVLRRRLRELVKKEDLEKLCFYYDSLAFERIPSFYGSPDGIPASELYTREDAEDALKKSQWIVRFLKSLMERSEK